MQGRSAGYNWKQQGYAQVFQKTYLKKANWINLTECFIMYCLLARLFLPISLFLCAGCHVPAIAQPMFVFVFHISVLLPPRICRSIVPASKQIDFGLAFVVSQIGDKSLSRYNSWSFNHLLLALALATHLSSEDALRELIYSALVFATELVAVPVFLCWLAAPAVTYSRVLVDLVLEHLKFS